MSLRRNRLAAAALVAVSATTLSACGTSFSAQTNQQYQAAVGANLRKGDLQLYNAVLVKNPDDTYTLSAGLLAEYGAQTITAVSVTSLSGTDAKATLTGKISVPENKLVKIGAKGEIIASGSALKDGEYATVTFTADPGGQIALDVPLVDRDMPSYDSIATAAPTPTPTSSPSASPATTTP